MTDALPEKPRGRPARVRIVKPASANPVWDELELLARQYRDLPPSPLPAEPASGDMPQATAPEDAQRARLRQRIWQSMAGTWVRMVADDVQADEPEAADETDAAHAEPLPASPDEAPGRLQRRDSALEHLFRIKANQLANRHGPWMQTAYGGPTDLSASAQQQFVLDKLAPMAKARGVTVLSALMQTWDPAQGNLQTFLGIMAERFLIDLARRLGALDGTLRHTQEATPAEWVPPADAAGGDREAQAGMSETPPLETWVRDEYDNPQEAAERRELSAALYAAVDQLPPKDRKLFQVWLSQCSQDWSDDLAAREAGLTRSTYARRRDKLADALRRQFDRSNPA